MSYGFLVAVQLRLIILLNSFTVPVTLFLYVLVGDVTIANRVLKCICLFHDVSSADAESIQNLWVWVPHAYL